MPLFLTKDSGTTVDIMHCSRDLVSLRASEFPLPLMQDPHLPWAKDSSIIYYEQEKAIGIWTSKKFNILNSYDTIQKLRTNSRVDR